MDHNATHPTQLRWHAKDHILVYLKPMTDDPSSPSKKLVEKLARETPFVCHAFSHEFLGRRTWVVCHGLNGSSCDSSGPWRAALSPTVDRPAAEAGTGPRSNGNWSFPAQRFHPSYTVLKGNSGISKNKGTPLWNFLLYSGRRNVFQYNRSSKRVAGSAGPRSNGSATSGRSHVGNWSFPAQRFNQFAHVAAVLVAANSAGSALHVARSTRVDHAVFQARPLPPFLRRRELRHRVSQDAEPALFRRRRESLSLRYRPWRGYFRSVVVARSRRQTGSSPLRNTGSSLRRWTGSSRRRWMKSSLLR